MNLAVVAPLLKLLPAPERYRVYMSLYDIKCRLQNSMIIAGPPLAQMNVNRVVAVHFPKAGGMSLLQQFAGLLRSQLAMDYSAEPHGPLDGPRRYPPHKSMVFGHFHPARYDSADAFRMTFLRDPVANLISLYFFWKTVRNRGNPVHDWLLRSQATLIDFARYPPITSLMSKTYFGGYDMSRFDFIGFDETRATDLRTLSRLLGVPLSGDVHVNKTNYSEEYAAARGDQRLRATLTDILAGDLRFYERLRGRR